MSKMPPCPRCRSHKSVYHDRDRNYYCRLCHIAFDDDPDEGGDYCTDPTRRIQREEERARVRREKNKGRR